MSAVSVRAAAIRGSIGVGAACLILLASLGRVIRGQCGPAVRAVVRVQAQQYAGRRNALMFHILFGTIALFTGPVQL